MDNCPKKDCHEPNALIFKKVVIPASVADDRVNPPKNGDYCNMLVEYAASGNVYIFSSDGIPTMISVDTKDINYAELLNKPKINSVELVGDKSLGDLGITDAISNAVSGEAEIRSTADQEIWTEIEAIEASSDVVDVVGTYDELQAYDTSKLKDNDLIKVLADETRDDTFTYVGAEGPYYTASETDTLLAAKQDTLIAGTNIQIAADGKTISATDTTYTHFTGATASADGTQGLVPAPVAGDQTKFLSGDGTWQTVQSGATQTIFYMNASETGATRHLYKASDMTGLATMQDIIDANEEGQVIVRISTSVDPSTYSDMYLQNAYVATGDYQMIFLDNQYYYSFDATQTSANTFQFAKSEVQRKLTAGTNVQINGNTISATDTTYSNFVGTDGLVAGAAGLVPAPAVADDNKYLKSDGTWATVQSGGSGIEFFYADPNDIHDNTYTRYHLYKDSSLTTVATVAEFISAFTTKGVYILAGSQVFSVVFGWDNDSSSWSSSEELFFELHTADVCIEIGNDYNTTDEFYTSEKNYVQHQLTAGTNISIGGNDVISVTGMPVLYGSQGQNTDGAVTQKLFTDTVGDVESILQILNSGAGV